MRKMFDTVREKEKGREERKERDQNMFLNLVRYHHREIIHIIKCVIVTVYS